MRYFPAREREQALVGGRFSGSNFSPAAGFQVLAEIKTAPQRGTWGELKFDNTTPYCWVRYEAPAGSHGNVAEIEFYAGGHKLAGGGFGSAGYLAPGIHWKGAFDRKTWTWFNSNDADGLFIGLDLGDQAATARVLISPGDGVYAQSQTVKMVARMPGGSIRYTLDGTQPTRTKGYVYCGVISVQPGQTVTAMAYKSGMADSAPIGMTAPRGS